MQITIAPTIVKSKEQIVKIDTVQPHPRNVRKSNVETIRTSLRAFGFGPALLVQKSTNFIIKGNHTWEAAKAEGFDKVPVKFVDWDDDKALRFMLMDNKSSDGSDYDLAALAALLEEIHDEGDDALEGTGFSEKEFKTLQAKAEADHAKAQKEAALASPADTHTNAAQATLEAKMGANAAIPGTQALSTAPARGAGDGAGKISIDGTSAHPQTQQVAFFFDKAMADLTLETLNRVIEQFGVSSQAEALSFILGCFTVSNFEGKLVQKWRDAATALGLPLPTTETPDATE